MITLQEAHQLTHQLRKQLESVIQGKSKEINYVLSCLLSGGHVLLEDNPGTGKTSLAKTLAASISEDQDAFKRIQFTPDLLPMDLLGTHIYNELKRDFEFRKGPLFTHVLLADEINRASPKVQSALLECMAENQITMGERTYPLSDMFFTIATQNPIDMEGTYPLPAAQLDRFTMRLSLGYAEEQTEFNLLKTYTEREHERQQLHMVMSLDQVRDCRNWVDQVFIHDDLIRVVLHLIRQTRNHPQLLLGASTRAGVAFIRALKAYAFLHERDYVVEEDIFQLTLPVLHHRCIYARGNDGRAILQTMLNEALRGMARK